jgi:uncharacterized protein (TIGR02594 family)
MSRLPTHYSWIAGLDPQPLMIRHALAEYGVVEGAGAADNPVILGWAAETGLGGSYSSDAIPWCGLFVAVVAKRAGKPAPDKPLWALSWARFGIAADRPVLGDVLVFRRDGGGHVGLYAGEDAHAFHVLGGNQSDRVCFTRIARARLHAARRPLYRAIPATARPYHLAPGGGLSVNEA